MLLQRRQCQNNQTISESQHIPSPGARPLLILAGMRLSKVSGQMTFESDLWLPHSLGALNVRRRKGSTRRSHDQSCVRDGRIKRRPSVEPFIDCSTTHVHRWWWRLTAGYATVDQIPVNLADQVGVHHKSSSGISCCPPQFPYTSPRTKWTLWWQ